ncbi:SusC/RagA family TonB-linked outer membrane protein [Pararcticibacter amylolyticus]|uniref:SusC/RagA family TonB-linked outer membrane protein n=1 Tax=Pararcticibacter amylolyticus TaxID=2173175 RepID=A0A2U2PJ50_9SPHI|nr:SusC/RagA family TonB-linked outer membrane protein [Pararcticibacter amylolyticus]PWG81425.1 SusC/RagA family TonB-linked outer membrane protein [Pararcticibacter amylolyticus]
MKVFTVIMTVLIVQVSARGFSQRVTINQKSASIKQIFKEIKSQTGYDVFYLPEMLPSSKTIKANFNQATLQDVISECISGLPLDYTIDDKTIVIQRKKEKSLSIGSLLSLPADVRGKVTDSLGNSLPGASIRVKGTKTTTMSDHNGEFVISTPGSDGVLIVSFIGYKTAEVAIGGGKSPLTIVLHELSSRLEEISIVNTGYQTLSKERVTGSFSRVTASSLQQQRLSSLGSLLEGRIAGYNNNLVRGVSTMRSKKDPLYVIDGFPVEETDGTTGSSLNGIVGLNLEDIESITVLKDAAAASIYGARAANGVVVIVTKKARKNKTDISVSSTFTMNPYRIYTDRLTSSSDIVELEEEWEANNPNLKKTGAAAYATSLLDNAVYTSQGITSILRRYTGQISDDQLQNTLAALASGGYNYYRDVEKYAKRNPFYQQYNISAASGSERNSFIASVSYRDNKNEDRNDASRSIGINLKNSMNLNKWLSVDINTYTSYSREKDQTFNPLSPGYSYMPYDRLVNPDGSYFVSTAASRLSKNTLNILQQNNMYNMDITTLDEIGQNIGSKQGFNNRSSINFNVKATNWISYNAMFQYDYRNSNNNTLYDKSSYYVRNRVNTFATKAANGNLTYNLPYGNIFRSANEQFNAYNFRQQLNIDKSFDKHNITAIAGTEIRESKMEGKNNTFFNYDPKIRSFSLVDMKTLAAPSGTLLGYASMTGADFGSLPEKTTRFVSIYGNAAYSYANKYMVTGSLRWDRSNLWGTSSKYQSTPIWSTGLGWNIDKEEFFNVQWIDQLKVRTSYGIGGNINTEFAPYLTAYYSSNNTVGGVQGTVGNRPNPLLSWEKTTTTNIGVDYSILHGRISGSADYYLKKGSDILANTMGVPTEGFGYSTYAMNNGKMENQGIELTLSADVVRSGDWSWNTTILYAHNKNKVTYVNVEAPVYYLQLDYPSAYPRIGNPYNAIYGYKWAGLNNKGLPQVYNEKNEAVVNNPTELASIVYAGTTVPINTASFNSLLKYKSFQFSFLFTYEGGHKMRNTDLPMLPANYNSALNGYVTQILPVNRDIVNRWRNPGDELKTNVPAVIFGESPEYNYNSAIVYSYADINVLDASNLRLRNISLAYNLPSGLVKQARLQNVRLQFNVENAFTIASGKTAKYLLNGYQTPNYVWGLYVNF